MLCQVGGSDLEEKKGLFENKELDVPEGTLVPYPIHQVLHTQQQGKGAFTVPASKKTLRYCVNNQNK